MSRYVRLNARTLVLLLVAAGAVILLLLMVTRNEFTTRLITERLFQSRDSTWQDMQARQSWRVGLDPSFPPFEMLDDAGTPVGYDVDLARALAAQWDMELEIVALGFDSLLDAVAAGKIDSAVSAMPYDPRATKDYAYSSPYFESGIRLAVASNSAIMDLDDLEGQTVAVEWGSMGDMVGRRLRREGYAIELTPYSTPEEAVVALSDDADVDALLLDNVTLRQAQGEGAAIKAVGPVLESNAYVIVMPLDADTLHDELENALAVLRAGGVLKELEDRWFGEIADAD